AESEGDGSVDASDADGAGGVISARCARKEGHRRVDSEVYDEGVGYVQLVPGASANAEEEDIGRFGRSLIHAVRRGNVDTAAQVETVEGLAVQVFPQAESTRNGRSFNFRRRDPGSGHGYRIRRVVAGCPFVFTRQCVLEQAGRIDRDHPVGRMDSRDDSQEDGKDECHLETRVHTIYLLEILPVTGLPTVMVIPRPDRPRR